MKIYLEVQNDRQVGVNVRAFTTAKAAIDSALSLAQELCRNFPIREPKIPGRLYHAQYMPDGSVHVVEVELIGAVLRRANMVAPAKKSKLCGRDNLTIDPDNWEVRKEGRRLDLTATELKFLFCLAENAGRVLTHHQLLEKVWGPEYSDETDYTKLFVWRLRQKIEHDPKNPQLILTERGVGYRLACVA